MAATRAGLAQAGRKGTCAITCIMSEALIASQHMTTNRTGTMMRGRGQFLWEKPAHSAVTNKNAHALTRQLGGPANKVYHHGTGLGGAATRAHTLRLRFHHRLP